MSAEDTSYRTGSTSRPGTLPVLVGVDGTEVDAAALAWAADEVSRSGGPLRVVHVVDPGAQLIVPQAVESPTIADYLEQHGRDILNSALARLAAVRAEGIDVLSDLEWGAPSNVLVDLSRQARLLVVGAHHRGRVERLVLGSASLPTVQHAHCPTVVVPVSHAITPLRHLVVAVDGSAPSARAVEFALTAAEAANAAVTCVIAWNVEFVDGVVVTEPGTQRWQAVHDRYDAVVHAVLDAAAARHPSVTVDVDVRHGAPAHAIVDAAAEKGAQLVVMGSRGMGGFRGLLLGSISKRVLEHTSIPVAVVH